MQPETQTSAEILQYLNLFTFEFSRFSIHCSSLANVQGLGECGCNGSLKKRLVHFPGSLFVPVATFSRCVYLQFHHDSGSLLRHF